LPKLDAENLKKAVGVGVVAEELNRDTLLWAAIDGTERGETMGLIPDLF